MADNLSRLSHKPAGSLFVKVAYPDRTMLLLLKRIILMRERRVGPLEQGALKKNSARY
jgi:hypothetical protein